MPHHIDQIVFKSVHGLSSFPGAAFVNAVELMNRNDSDNNNNNADLYLMDTAAITITTTTTITIHKYKAYLVRTLARVKYFHMALNLFSRAWPRPNLSQPSQPAWLPGVRCCPRGHSSSCNRTTVQPASRSTCAVLHSVCAARLTSHKYRLLCTRNVR